MKRDPRLRGLSSEHHQALVLARSVLAAAAAGKCMEDLKGRFREELEPHFLTEERWLLPGLEAAGAHDLAAQTREDHAFLRAAVEAAQRGDPEAMAAFATRLQEHVRFEERALFPACEELLPGELLEAVARGA
ncbi:MAG: hemerythrin domain-containing protein [Polyangiaceae bacterium]|jgi:iron-sulfur cluster repair protein YtfE (RIC family)|nr:hemerythrin domain-containing protein [Polyangiaceae bacterium]